MYLQGMWGEGDVVGGDGRHREMEETEEMEEMEEIEETEEMEVAK